MNWLYGQKAKLSYLILAASFLLLAFLGAREIWTQEHRWADIVAGMFYRNDFLHPYLGENTYYDKPLLSYWLIAFFTQLTGSLSLWSLRLPSALAGLLGIWSIYQLGVTLKNKELGLLSGWMLLTTFYFVFWARTASADMLNLAGTLFAVSWYISKREHTKFLDYCIFFLILACTSLCKGLIGAIIPLIAVLTDLLLSNTWKQHLRLPLFLSVIPAFILYLLPFFASAYYDGQTYGENGLYLVYRENFLRYFQPFDHRGPIYTYFIYLPVYLFPWVVFLIPALVALKKQWKILPHFSKWNSLTCLFLFLFLTLSGSRRSYYVLPIIPFVILFIADWMVSSPHKLRYLGYSSKITIVFFSLFFMVISILPSWYYSRFGIQKFAQTIQSEANKIKPWHTWNIVMLDGESKLNFYLNLPPITKNYGIKGERNKQSKIILLQSWPILKNVPSNTIFITRKIYVSTLQEFFPNYRLIQMSDRLRLSFEKESDENISVAFIPQS